MTKFSYFSFPIVLVLVYTASGNPLLENNVDSNVIASNSGFADELNKCVYKSDVTEIAGCATERIVRSLDKLSAQQNLEILPGVALLGDGTSNFRAGKELNQELEEAKQDESSMLHLIGKHVGRFFAGRTLKVKLPDTETISRALVEGRKKMNKNKNMMGMGAMGIGAALAALAPLFLGKIALITAKALIVGKIALVLSAILLVQMFTGNKGNQGSSDSSAWASAPVYREPAPSYGAPSSSYGAPSSAYGAPSPQYPYSRSFDVSNENVKYSQELAYAAQK
ncbi:uncharacterized protein LOC115891697 [Sitophilus oryzae]|uniref:Uncharacterized protein LOC115891697 n=1 Tax=Sitophilus oryzae TaxID=7048 RepID=A0A6J2YVF6_SITOR|nr:uncharacterized protein LOC115891697 [Sitophilus oryzae]